METGSRRLFALLLSVELMLCQTVPVFALEPDSAENEVIASLGKSDGASVTTLCIGLSTGDVVFDEDELAEWLTAHEETGGTVALGAAVKITKPVNIPNPPITIDTGAFGLVFDGSVISDKENVQITGEGVDFPVVELLGVNGIRMGNWNNYLFQMNVTATGRNGQGGCAFRVSAADERLFSVSSVSGEQGTIRSYGEGAIGLELCVPVDAYCFRVEVFGENSIAAYAPKGGALYYCKLTADGEGAAAVKGDDVLLDTCAVFPTASDVKNISRHVLESSFVRLYIPVRQHDHADAYAVLYDFNLPTFFLSGYGEFPEVARPFPVDWDCDAYDDIAKSLLGKTSIQGTVSPVFHGLGLFDGDPIALTVEVRDPALPCIERVVIKEYDEERHVYLNCWESYDPSQDDVILWRSDDEGETWRDATLAPDILWEESFIDFSYDRLPGPAWFQLEVAGTGESNIVVIFEIDGRSYGGNGGDRTGTDRGGVSIPGTGGDTGGSAAADGDNTDESDTDRGKPSGGGAVGGATENQPGNSRTGNGSGTGGSDKPMGGGSPATVSLTGINTSQTAVPALPGDANSSRNAPGESAPDAVPANAESEGAKMDSEKTEQTGEAAMIHNDSITLAVGPPPDFDPGQSAPGASGGARVAMIASLCLATGAGAAILGVKLGIAKWRL